MFTKIESHGISSNHVKQEKHDQYTDELKALLDRIQELKKEKATLKTEIRETKNEVRYEKRSL